MLKISQQEEKFSILRLEIYFIQHFSAYAGASGMAENKNIEILCKFYSDNDSVVSYGRFIKREISTPDYPDWQYYEEFDTISYGFLYDTIFADTVYEDEYQYNGRKTTFSHNYDTLYYTHNTLKYTVGCGQVYQEYDEMSGSGSAYSELELVYFKKGDEEWGEEQVIVGTPEISKKQRLMIFPNPTTDYLNISCNDAIANSSILIFNTNGQLQLSKKLNARNERISVSGLPSGVYLAQQIDSGGNIIARMKFINK